MLKNVFKLSQQKILKKLTPPQLKQITPTKHLQKIKIKIKDHQF